MRWQIRLRPVFQPQLISKLKYTFVFVLFLEACAHPTLKPTVVELRRAEKNAQKRNVMSGSGSIAWVSKLPKRNIAAAGVLVVAWPDKLRMEVNDPLGNILALLIVNGEESYWLAEKQKALYSRNGLKSLLNLPFSAHDLVQAFLARPNFADFSLSDEGEGELVYRRQQDKKKERLVINGRMNEPELWSSELENHESVRADYEDYTTHTGIEFPGTLRLTWSGKEMGKNSLVWRWRDAEMLLPDNPKLFQIPKSNSSGQAEKSF